MKIQGVKESTFIKVEKISIPAYDAEGREIEVEFTLASIPLGFERKIEKELPLPSVPKTAAVVDGQRRVDHKGRPILEPDEDDPDYKERVTYVIGLRAVATLKEALRMDKNVQFESQRAGYETAEDYYDAIFEEFEQAGFTLAVIKQLVEKATEISGIKREDIEKARFFS